MGKFGKALAVAARADEAGWRRSDRSVELAMDRAEKRATRAHARDAMSHVDPSRTIDGDGEVDRLWEHVVLPADWSADDYREESFP
jgi:hypothetical protein